MVYKRYVRKKGKKYGPYYYTSIRDDSGRVKNIYVGNTLEEALAYEKAREVEKLEKIEKKAKMEKI